MCCSGFSMYKCLERCTLVYLEKKKIKVILAGLITKFKSNQLPKVWWTLLWNNDFTPSTRKADCSFLQMCSASGTDEDKTHLPFACGVMPTSCYVGMISVERVSNQKYCSLVPVAVCDGNQYTITPWKEAQTEHYKGKSQCKLKSGVNIHLCSWFLYSVLLVS